MAGSGNSQRRRAAVVAFLIANNITDAERLDLSHPVLKDLSVAELGECLAAACRACSSASEPMVRRMMAGGDYWSLTAPGVWRPISELKNHEIHGQLLWSNVIFQQDNTVKIAFVSDMHMQGVGRFRAMLIQNAADNQPGELFLIRSSSSKPQEAWKAASPSHFGINDRRAYSASIPVTVAVKMLGQKNTLQPIPVAEPFFFIYRLGGFS